jgi:hypothetical protein
LDNPELLKFKNAWEWLSTSRDELALIKPIQWRNPKVEKLPTKHSVVLQAVVAEAEKRGLLVESPEIAAPYEGVQAWILMEKKRCQIFWAKTFKNGNCRCIALTLPKSDWAEFFIYCVTGVETNRVTYYVFPRSELPYNTTYSTNSNRLRRFEAAWNLLK